MKRCSRCDSVKAIDEFPPNRAQRDGRQSYCRPCQRVYMQAYRAANREHAVAYAKAYYRANRERWQYPRDLTPEKIEQKREYTRMWRIAHPDWVKLLNRANNKVRWALRTGRLTRANACEWCGASNRKISGAHWDYDQPLEVIWLCYPCHAAWDSSNPKLPREKAS